MRKYPLPSSWSIHALRSDIQTKEELDQTEKDFIRFLRSQDPEYGYNICRGGEGHTGPLSQESVKKISASLKKLWGGSKGKELRRISGEASDKRWAQPGKKERASETMREIWQQLKHREHVLGKLRNYWSGISDSKKAEISSRISATLMGHFVSEKSRVKMSLALKGKPSWNKDKNLSRETKNKVSVSITKLWEDPLYREHMVIAASHPKPYLRKRFCKHGHDTNVCGRYPNGNCRGCHLRLPHL